MQVRFLCFDTENKIIDKFSRSKKTSSEESINMIREEARKYCIEHGYLFAKINVQIQESEVLVSITNCQQFKVEEVKLCNLNKSTHLNENNILLKAKELFHGKNLQEDIDSHISMLMRELQNRYLCNSMLGYCITKKNPHLQTVTLSFILDVFSTGLFINSEYINCHFMKNALKHLSYAANPKEASNWQSMEYLINKIFLEKYDNLKIIFKVNKELNQTTAVFYHTPSCFTLSLLYSSKMEATDLKMVSIAEIKANASNLINSINPLKFHALFLINNNHQGTVVYSCNANLYNMGTGYYFGEFQYIKKIQIISDYIARIGYKCLLGHKTALELSMGMGYEKLYNDIIYGIKTSLYYSENIKLFLHFNYGMVPFGSSFLICKADDTTKDYTHIELSIYNQSFFAEIINFFQYEKIASCIGFDNERFQMKLFSGDNKDILLKAKGYIKYTGSSYKYEKTIYFELGAVVGFQNYNILPILKIRFRI